jgi:hypothetical protein
MVDKGEPTTDRRFRWIDVGLWRIRLAVNGVDDVPRDHDGRQWLALFAVERDLRRHAQPFRLAS